jgi:cytochrome b6-f complex iron-sulfur subunit
MERRKFIKTCCYTAIGIPFGASMLQSCGAIYYASLSKEPGKLVVAKSEFINEKNNKKTTRDFVLLNMNELGFPICLYKVKDEYIASLLKCTHRGCELNVGGGIYSCPCHGSEFSTTGQVLEGPADQNLKVYKTETDEKNIYIYLS